MHDLDGLDVLLTSPAERAILAAGLELLLKADEALGIFAQDPLPCAQRAAIVELQERVQPDYLEPDEPAYSPTAAGLLLDARLRTAPHGDPHREPETPGVTRPSHLDVVQQLAGDAMAAKRRRDGSRVHRTRRPRAVAPAMSDVKPARLWPFLLLQVAVLAPNLAFVIFAGSWINAAACVVILGFTASMIRSHRRHRREMAAIQADIDRLRQRL